MNDLVEATVCTNTHLVVSALRSNAGAGGAILPLSADYVLMRDGVILNPHYKSMGLYGSEYWTYLLPRRVGVKAANELTNACLPIGSRRAAELKMVDQVLPSDRGLFDRMFRQYCEKLANSTELRALLAVHNAHRMLDECQKPLAAYREEELDQMKLNFYADNWGYAEKRRAFVRKLCPTHTPDCLKQGVNLVFKIDGSREQLDGQTGWLRSIHSHARPRDSSSLTVTGPGPLIATCSPAHKKQLRSKPSVSSMPRLRASKSISQLMSLGRSIFDKSRSLAVRTEA